MADWLTTWSVWHWLVLGFVLLIAETLVPGVFLLWWGLAAIAGGGFGIGQLLVSDPEPGNIGT